MFKKRKQNRNLALLAFAVAFALWGGNNVAIKVGLEQLPLYAFVCFRFLAAGLILLPFVRKKWKKLKFSVWVKIFIGTLLGYTISTTLCYIGIERTGSLNTSLLFLLSPVIMYVFSMELLKEGFNAKILTGLLVSLAGSLLIVVAPLAQQGAGGGAISISGNILIVIAIIAGALGTIFIKPQLKKVPAAQMTTMRFLIGGSLLIPLAVADLLRNGVPTLTMTSGIAAIYNVVFASIIAFSLYHFGLNKLSGEESSVFEYLEPVFGVVASIIILGEVLEPVAVLGAVFALAGIYLAEVKIKHHHFFAFLHKH